MIKEIWKDIKDYVGLYQISNLGRVKSLAKPVHYSDGRTQHRSDRILKSSISSSRGYCRVNLIKDGKQKTTEIHRIVARHFLEDFHEKCVVDHIDNNKLNNLFTNLRITDYYGNAQNARKLKNKTSKYKGVCFNGSSWVAQITLNKITTYIGSFPTEVDAAIAYNNMAKKHYGKYAYLNEV